MFYYYLFKRKINSIQSYLLSITKMYLSKYNYDTIIDMLNHYFQ